MDTEAGETGGDCLVAEFGTGVEMGEGEAAAAVVAPVPQDVSDFAVQQLGGESGVHGVVLEQAVPADSGGGDDPAGPGDADGLGEGGHPVGPGREVVERAEEQYDVEGRVLGGQGPGVTEFGRAGGVRGGLREVLRYGVHEVHGVAVLGEPAGMGAGAAAYVEDPGRPGRQEGPDQLLGPQEFEAARRGGVEPLGLAELRVVVGDLPLDHVHAPPAG